MEMGMYSRRQILSDDPSNHVHKQGQGICDVLTSHDFKAALMSPKCVWRSWCVKGVINGRRRVSSGFVRNIRQLQH